MEHIALYRKWRPTGFFDLIGQKQVSESLTKAIQTGNLSHAYLFSGPRGTGKTSTARIIAKGLNCEHGPTSQPCNQCENCLRTNEGSSMDVYEIDAATNRGIDEIRKLRETVKFASVNGKYKIYIIDEVHMLSTEAFNALLKTLEEPPEHIVFILATTEVNKVPITIQSRCQCYAFKRIQVHDIVDRLRFISQQEKILIDEAALTLIAEQSDGGMRDALKNLEQCAVMVDEHETITEDLVRDVLGLVSRQSLKKILQAIAEKNIVSALQAVDEILQAGKDVKRLLEELLQLFRVFMIFQSVGKMRGLEISEKAAAFQDIFEKNLNCFSLDDFEKIMKRLQEAMTELRWTTQPRITLETALLSLCAAERTPAPVKINSPAQQNFSNDVSQKILALEEKIRALSEKIQTMPQKTQPTFATQANTKTAEKIFSPSDGKETWKKFLTTLRQDSQYLMLYRSLLSFTFLGKQIENGVELFFVTCENKFMFDYLNRNEEYNMHLNQVLTKVNQKPSRIFFKEKEKEKKSAAAKKKISLQQDMEQEQEKQTEKIRSSLPNDEARFLRKAEQIFDSEAVYMGTFPDEEPPYVPPEDDF